MTRVRLLASLVGAALLVGACSGSPGDQSRSSAPAPSDDGGARQTQAPEATVAPAGPQPATPNCPAVPARVAPDPDRPSYLMDVDVRLADGLVEGRLVVRFTPDVETDRLVFRLWPNGPRPAAAGARLDAGPVYLGSSAPVATERPDPTTLVVPLDDPLSPGEEVEATVPWRLRLPGPSDDRLAREGDALRLGSFFPILAWEPGVGWATEPATGGFAEASTAPVADFSYAVRAPEGLSVLATGTRREGRWRAPATRDVALSIGRFETATATARAPGPVEVTVGVDEGIDEDPGAYLETVVAALEDFATRLGPYPYPSLSLALTPGLSGGVEYPGHIMQGPRTLDGTTPHEVAHQWFYGLVGNDQGRDPWLDEGLATWAEARFQGTLDAYVDTPIPSAARGRLGAPMTYWDPRPEAYFRGVYVQGAQALAALGDPAVVDCGLRQYVARQAFALARPEDLRAALAGVLPGADRALAPFGAGP